MKKVRYSEASRAAIVIALIGAAATVTAALIALGPTFLDEEDQPTLGARADQLPEMFGASPTDAVSEGAGGLALTIAPRHLAVDRVNEFSYSISGFEPAEVVRIGLIDDLADEVAEECPEHLSAEFVVARADAEGAASGLRRVDGLGSTAWGNRRVLACGETSNRRIGLDVLLEQSKK